MKEFCPNCKKEFDKKAIEKYEAMLRSSVNEKVTSKIDRKIPINGANAQNLEFRRVPTVRTPSPIFTTPLMPVDGGTAMEIQNQPQDNDNP